MNKEKIKELQLIIKKKKLDGIILTTTNSMTYNKNIKYLTDFKGYCFLIIKKNDLFLLVPELEKEKAKKTKIKIKPLNKNINSLEKIFKNNDLKDKNLKLGIDKSNTTVKHYEFIKKQVKAKYIDVNEFLSKLKIKKTEQEIKLIKEACKITDDIFNKIINNFNFKTEQEIKNFIRKEIQDNNCKESFEPLIASSKNSSIVHYFKADQKLKKGFLLMDFGVEYYGYCSDMTRTIYLGKPSNDEINNYNLLLKLQSEAILKLKTGIKISDIAKDVRKKLGNLNKFFIHTLGHGVGMDVHELPIFHKDSKEKFIENQIITVEPGIYFQNKYGIRIEDTVLVKKNNAIRLTKSSKDLIIIKSFK